MIWWFLILGISTLAVVCVAIAVFVRLRRHLQTAQAGPEETTPAVVELEGGSGKIEP
jgi:hypothetical protein